MERPFASVAVTEKAARALRGGHPWVFAGEVLTKESPCPDGEIVDVYTEKGRWQGAGFYNSRSLIRVRILSRNTNDKMDEAFFRRRVRYALAYRQQVMGNDFAACRLIFGEADGFPGLTVDRFGEVLVTQSLSVGIERYKDIIFPLLYEVLTADGQKISGIYERNDVAIRTLEGLSENKSWYDIAGVPHPESTETEIIENGIKYSVDFENGQKTGFFLDQKYNRLAVSKIAKGKRVLDCFTHTGSFALNAAKGGAKQVCAVDISESAIEMAKRNAAANSFSEKMTFRVEDVFDLFPKLEEEHEKFDFIILDPPAFTKSRKTVESASKGYKEINLRAMKALPRGGYLATCSCSHFMTEELFVKMLRSAAKDACVELRQIEARRQSPDHPILWNVPETDYLKFYIFQVI